MLDGWRIASKEEASGDVQKVSGTDRHCNGIPSDFRRDPGQKSWGAQSVLIRSNAIASDRRRSGEDKIRTYNPNSRAKNDLIKFYVSNNK